MSEASKAVPIDKLSVVEVNIQVTNKYDMLTMLGWNAGDYISERLFKQNGEIKMYSKQRSELDLFVREFTQKEEHSRYLRITKNDEIIYEQSIGYADRENKIPFTRDSVFTFYSLSKPFCAIGILKLADLGMVDIDAHPSKYVPEAAGFDEQVTIRMALHHISGIPDFEQNEKINAKYSTGKPEKIRTQLIELAKLPNVFKPGTAAMYANINFIICALIIENVTGRRYDEYMQNEVFKSLCMKKPKLTKRGFMSKIVSKDMKSKTEESYV